MGRTSHSPGPAATGRPSPDCSVHPMPSRGPCPYVRGDGPAVVMSHGFLMDHEMFAPQVAALAPEFRVITWDERGFGATEFDGKPFSYYDSANDCMALLDHLS